MPKICFSLFNYVFVESLCDEKLENKSEKKLELYWDLGIVNYLYFSD